MPNYSEDWRPCDELLPLIPAERQRGIWLRTVNKVFGLSLVSFRELDAWLDGWVSLTKAAGGPDSAFAVPGTIRVLKKGRWRPATPREAFEALARFWLRELKSEGERILRRLEERAAVGQAYREALLGELRLTLGALRDPAEVREMLSHYEDMDIGRLRYARDVVLRLTSGRFPQATQ
ncbi:MAG: hypothetical protein Kow0025_21080 [Thermodesulfovibrionales bacterium]